MYGRNDLTSVPQYFPKTCWSFPTRGNEEGLVVRFPEGFYLKIYYNEKQNDVFDIVGGWSGEVNPCLNISVPSKEMKQWCSQITSASAFMKVVHSSGSRSC